MTMDDTQWKNSLKNAFRQPHDLLKYLDVSIDKNENNLFSLLVPMSYAEKMKKSDPLDPLLLQVLPALDERNESFGFSQDPLLESKYIKAPAIIQKYHNRILIMTSIQCAVHCRYCFRKYFPYNEHRIGIEQLKENIKTQVTPDIEEVILSGGDPLILDSTLFIQLLEFISKINTIQKIRIHTRIPIVLPNRIYEAFVRKIKNISVPVVFVVHANHPNEIQGDTLESLSLLSENFLTYNQSVLLKNINDQASILKELHRRLVRVKITPYYLHQLDPVQGTQHFEVSTHRGKEIMQQLHKISSGYELPKYVQEISGENGKTILY